MQHYDSRCCPSNARAAAPTRRGRHRAARAACRCPLGRQFGFFPSCCCDAQPQRQRRCSQHSFARPLHPGAPAAQRLTQFWACPLGGDAKHKASTSTTYTSAAPGPSRLKLHGEAVFARVTQNCDSSSHLSAKTISHGAVWRLTHERSGRAFLGLLIFFCP